MRRDLSRGIYARCACKMKGAMTTDTPKRKKPYSYRPPQDKRARFEAMVEESGLPVNAFITECVFGRSRHRPAEVQKLAQILGQCAAIADQLRDIQLSGAETSTLLIEEMADELRLIRTSIMTRMGRRS